MFSKMYLFILERGHVSGGGEEGEEEGSQRQGSVSWPWYNDLSWMFNWLSLPGAPEVGK